MRHSPAVQLLATVVFVVSLIAYPRAQGSSEDAVETNVFGSWTITCQQAMTGDVQESAATGPSCQMSQELRNADNDQRVFAIALPAVASSSGANALIVAPFGLQLDKGISIEIDGDSLADAGFHTCLPVGCLAQLMLDTEQIGRLAGGRSAIVTMWAADDGQPLQLQVSMDGFADAYEHLTGALPTNE